MSHNFFTIRSATPGDVSAVLPMVAAICGHHEQIDPSRFGMLPDVVQRYERWLPQRASDPRSVFLVADAGEPARVVAFLVATIEQNIPIYQLAEFAYLHDVWVDPEFRRHGIAKAIVEEACGRFREMGVRQARLETAHANEEARRVCIAAGFRVSTVDLLRDL